MMKTKLFELRDRSTFIPIIATLLYSFDSCDRYLLGRCGYKMHELATRSYLVARLDGTGKAHCDQHDWTDRTFRTAHDWIERHWERLESGDVIDVENILGETAERKRSERYTTGPSHG